VPAIPATARSLRAAERLVAELEAGRFDSTLVRHMLAGGNPYPRLLRACYLAEHGHLGRARDDIEAALRRGAGQPVVELSAGLLLFVTHDYQRALDRFARAASEARSPGAARRARQLGIVAALALGWDHDALALLAEAVAAEPEHASWQVQRVRVYARGGWPERALEHAAEALALAPQNPSLWMQVAVMRASLDQPDPREQVWAAVEQALAHAPAEQRGAYLREAARVAVEVGAFARAQACYAEALALGPADPDTHVALAELHSWADRDADAHAEAERALAIDGEHGPALRMLGALAVRAGDPSQARSLLARAIAAAPSDSQAHLWLAELELRAGHYEQVHAHLHAAVSTAGGHLIAAALLRFLAVAYEEGPEADGRVPQNRSEELDAALDRLCPDLAATALASRAHADMVAAAEAALAALRGNRSIYPTHLVDGVLHRLPRQGGVRSAARAALQRLRVASPEQCLAGFDEVERRYPSASLPACHRGELRLWLGDWAGARHDLEAAIAKVTGTRWAYIGLSTLDLLADDPQACLATNARGVAIMRDTEGPALWVFRGEALRRLGRHDDAIVELERAVAAHPARASAVINLALALAARGEHDRVHALWRRLADEQACGLCSDAARERGEGLALAAPARIQPAEAPVLLPAARTAFVARGEPPAIEVIVAILTRALAMMGGNRSSGLLSYWTSTESGAAKLRFVDQWPHANPSPHTQDPVRIGQAKALLLKALARASGA
jgi:tetratricopeptide (TPR) repeat protein